MKLILDKQKQDDVCAILSVGGTRDMAARYVGCCVRTIRNHAKSNPEFAARLQKCETNPELELLKGMYEIAVTGKNWRAMKWMLERLYVNEYGPRKPHAVNPRQMTELLTQLAENTELVVTDPEQRAEIARGLAKMLDEWNEDMKD